jgi:hypothetical protein
MKFFFILFLIFLSHNSIIVAWPLDSDESNFIYQILKNDRFIRISPNQVQLDQSISPRISKRVACGLSKGKF